MIREMRRGEIYYANLGISSGSEQAGKRPVIVVQNNIGNKFSPTVIVASITASTNKHDIPTHVNISGELLFKPSIILLEQLKTIDKKKIIKYIGTVSKENMKEIDRALAISVGLENILKKGEQNAG